MVQKLPCGKRRHPRTVRSQPPRTQGLDRAKHAPRPGTAGRAVGGGSSAPSSPSPAPPRPAQKRAAADPRERGSAPRAARRRPAGGRSSPQHAGAAWPGGLGSRGVPASLRPAPPASGTCSPAAAGPAHLPARRAPPRTPTVAAAPPAERLTFKSSRFAAKFPPLGKFWGPIQGPGVGSRGEADGLGGRRANSAAPTRRRGKGEGEGEEGAGSLGGVIPSDPSLPALAARRDLSADFPPPRRWRLWLSPSRHHRQCLRLWALGSGYFQFCSTTYKRVISGNLPLFAK